MGILGRVARAAASAAVEGAKNKARKANKHYCPVSGGRHHMTRHRNTDLPDEVHATGRHVGITHIMYCKDCGWTEGHKR